MADPASSMAAAVVTASGITIFGVALGLQPEIMVAGLAGGLWAVSFQPEVSVLKRLGTTVLAAVLAGYGAPMASAGVTALPAWPDVLTRELVQLPIAVLIGLLSHSVLGPTLLRIAQRKADEVSK